ncbi:MAG: RraA family protein [Phycisphaerae bacterium]
MDNQSLLDAFECLRLADVRDGMDALGYHHYGSMSPQMRPLWPTRAAGIARTVRYLPYQGPAPRTEPDEYMQWAGSYYRDVCPYPWIERIEPGDLIVIDQSGINAGLMGSENTLSCLRKGARGLVSNGGVRDTDEVVLQEVPFWAKFRSQSMVQGRLQFDAMDVPVAVDGVQVRPGDVVVADGDGVIVVPREVAVQVAQIATAEHDRDRKVRREHYRALGRDADKTV